MEGGVKMERRRQIEGRRRNRWQTVIDLARIPESPRATASTGGSVVEITRDLASGRVPAYRALSPVVGKLEPGGPLRSSWAMVAITGNRERSDC